MKRQRYTVVLAAVALVCGSRWASAQDAQQPAQPPVFRGLFGGAAPTRPERQILALSASLLEGFSDNLLIDTVGIAPLSKLGGFYTGATGSLDFESRGDRLQTKISAGSSIRHYSGFNQTAVVNHFADGDFTIRLGRSTAVVLNESIAYSPTYLYGLFANLVGQNTPNPFATTNDTVMNPFRSYTYGSSAAVTQAVGKRGSVSFDARWRLSDFVNNPPGVYDFRTYDIGGRFTYGLTRFASLRLGYIHRRSEYSPEIRPVERNIDAGIDYNRPLSRTRRTFVAFSVGSTSVSGPVLGGALTDARQQYGITGDAWLSHQIGRTWHLQAGYQRRLVTIEGLQTPLFTSGASVSGNGLIGRRIDVAGSAAATVGDSPLMTIRSRVSTYTANARLRYALARMWAAYVEYQFYFYDFDRNLQLIPGVTPRLESNAIRAGVTLWVPVWRRK